MLNIQFWSNPIIKQQKQEDYINLQIDQLDNLLTTCPFQPGWEMSIEMYPNWQFGCIDDPDHLLDNGALVQIQTQIRNGGPKLLLTLERDDLTLCSEMMVELWMGIREMGKKMRTM